MISLRNCLTLLLLTHIFTYVAYGDDSNDMYKAIQNLFSDPKVLDLLYSYGAPKSPSYGPPPPPPSAPHKVWGQPAIGYEPPAPPSYPSPAPPSYPSPTPPSYPSPSPTSYPSPTPASYPSPTKPSYPSPAPPSYPPPTPSKSGLKYRGVNQAGADFAGTNLPGKYGTDYKYPEPDGSTASFVKMGMNYMRMPFLLERLFPDATNFNEDEWSKFKASVAGIKAAGASVLLDPHNYWKFYGSNIGEGKMSIEQYASAYEKIATEYKNDDKVHFGLMNEPHDVSSELVKKGFAAAIKAIRGCGAKNLIVVSGNAWDNAKNWMLDWYGTSNSVWIPDLLKQFNDDNIKVEVHVYFDADSSGTTPQCVSPEIGAEQLAPITNSFKQHGIKALLTEFGASVSCSDTLDKTLKHISDNTDVWEGYTYWAAGPIWGDYIFSVDPKTPGDKPQLAVLEKYC